MSSWQRWHHWQLVGGVAAIAASLAVPSTGWAQTSAIAVPSTPTDVTPASLPSTQAADLLPATSEMLVVPEPELTSEATSVLYSAATLAPHPKPLSQTWERGFEETDFGVSIERISTIPEPFSDIAQGIFAEPTPTPLPPLPADPNAGIRIPPNFGENLPIERVFIDLRTPTGEPIEDGGLQQQLGDTFGIRAGGTFSPLFADQGLNQVQRLPFVQAAEYRLYESNRPGSVIVALLVTLQPEVPTMPPEAPPAATGLVVSGDWQDFPTLYQSDRALAKITLNGSVGLFSDTNPWFGNAANFVAGPYQPTDTVTWGEFYLEPGLAGITRLGDWPLYIYGAGSYTVSSSLQPDIFRTDDRLYGAVEKLYGGVLVAEPGSPVAFNLSAGRQNFQLNQGFLFSQFSGSANALERGASYSNPRTAYDMTVLANLRWGDWRLQGFFLEPDELPIADSDTQYLGTSLSYNNNQGFEAVLSYITVPQSERVYVRPNGEPFTREGLQVINPRVRLSPLLGVSGLWAEGEYAYEFGTTASVSAHGGYVWLGYTAADVPWRPSVSYRFAGFSGDDPATATYERFDPLQAGGLSDWLQGISLGKVYNNANSFSHRLTFQVQPTDSLSVSLDYYYRFADELNNLGGNRALSALESPEIGHEWLLTTRYFLSQNFMLQGVGAIAFPSRAIRQAVDDSTHPWITLQLSLFMFF